jgi:hypothetical protein
MCTDCHRGNQGIVPGIDQRDLVGFGIVGSGKPVLGRDRPCTCTQGLSDDRSQFEVPSAAELWGFEGSIRCRPS